MKKNGVSHGSARANLAMCSEKDYLEQMLKRFWALEESELAPEQENISEEIFKSTVFRDDCGRYGVQIPFKPDAPALGDSYEQAEAQFHRLERRLAKNDELKAKYKAFMDEYLALGHMEKVNVSPEDRCDGYYIPHHAVLEKFRTVFNGSAKTSNGVSLNDTQMTGPDYKTHCSA